MGFDGLSQKLDAVAELMRDARAEFQSGSISAAEYEQRMGAATVAAARLLTESTKIDGVDLSAVRGEVAGLSAVLEFARNLAIETHAAVAGAIMDGTSEGVGTGGAGAGASAFGTINLGTKPGGGSVGGRSGGGGNGKLAALLADLQSEREAMGAWYAESQALLASATDAQLAAVGGRHNALERLEVEHQERMRGIQDVSQSGNLANAETFFGAMATLTAAGGQKMVKAQRAFAAAEALINTLRAQAAVLATPGLTVFGRFAAYASIGAAGMGLVSALGGKIL